METNNIINIPEGFEIDKEQSTERQIVLKKIDNRAHSWEEYCEKMNGKDSYYRSDLMNESVVDVFKNWPIFSVQFADREDVEALVAYNRLLHLRKDWVGYWKPDWTKKSYKFTIITQDNNVCRGTNSDIGRSISFPTVEMRDEFFDTFKDLLEQAKTLL